MNVFPLISAVSGSFPAHKMPTFFVIWGFEGIFQKVEHLGTEDSLEFIFLEFIIKSSLIQFPACRKRLVKGIGTCELATFSCYENFIRASEKRAPAVNIISGYELVMGKCVRDDNGIS